MTVSLPGTGIPNGRGVTTVLGPTNTGKTHLAVERMLAHETGMIGLPLRLLAREVYDRIVALRGSGVAALVTGEERIVPPDPRYFVCTVEAMPADREVDFLAIDEVQLAADPERGHVFTDRLLHSRGGTETMLLGAATIKPLIERLLPGSNFVSRPRFSRLIYAGQKKITRLPRRSAVIAFSADSVYAIAELLRRQRGGAAVVLGALSPRTRNAQVALYQSGDVDFLVATDAIGMGLNMDVRHVAFSATRKFDGRGFRELNAAELAQIAGRAGRHMNDGSFGVTADASPLDAGMIERIEDHRFDALKVLQWRNRAIDFSSLESLRESLNRPPPRGALSRARSADDVLALEHLSRDHDIQEMARDAGAVRRLWEVCRIPDYRNITGDDHASLVGTVFRHLMSEAGVVPADWLDGQLSYADRTDGDIDTLATRIAHIRTWSFISNRSGWLDNPAGWRERTRDIEDRLSDALHRQLTQRFIDRRTSVLMKRLREKEDLMAAVSGDGEILVEGEFVGRLTGLRFVPDSHGEGVHGRALRAASLKVIAGEIAQRAERLSRSPDPAFDLSARGEISWHGETVAKVRPGESVLRPRISLAADDRLSGPPRDAVQQRLGRWLSDRIANRLAPLISLASDEEISGLARGIAFQLVENLGVLVRDTVADDLRDLDQEARGRLRRHGVRFGAFHVFVPALLKPAPAQLRLLLWALGREAESGVRAEDLPALPPDGLTSAVIDRSAPAGFYQAVGYRVLESRAVRIDMLERLGDLIRERVYWKPGNDGDTRPEGSVAGGGFTVVPDMMSLVGCSGDDFSGILRGLGFRMDRRPAAPETAENEPVPAEPSSEAGPSSTEAAAHAASGPPSAAPSAIAGRVKTPQENRDAAPAPEISRARSETAAEREEPQFIEVWRPRRQAAKPQGGQQARSAGAHGKGAPHKRKGGPRKSDGKQPRAKRKDATGPHGSAPARRKPEVDMENSPFAALSALKKAMEDSVGGK